ncbi:DUF427 domain-containing protein [Nocardioides sp. B-3]|uniref:DUF427 domain-containing protein n=1 Tax=Nocardioides sp. B-3 TaxID=2895565 RepID=UPI00215376FB|nr:DUF427 domain-containing protein [Nocardioides sp. B-3]UUZ61391.1 DUF427 domain-containing protein [Nocardioides sp. B-3]
MEESRTEHIDKWVRGRLGDEVVVESRTPLLVWQGGFPPVYGFARTEVTPGALRPTDASAYAGEWFFGPHQPVTQWYDVVAGDEVVECGAWTFEDLPDPVSLTREPGRLSWTEEDEPVGLHPRDPHKRVEALHSSRHVSVTIGDEVVAESDRPVVLLETHLPTRYYLPRDDVRLDLPVATDNVSTCPYKGTADAYWSFPGPPSVANVAWSYASPLPTVAGIEGRIAFYNELVDLRVDGVLLERPVSPFSKAEQRPGGE